MWVGWELYRGGGQRPETVTAWRMPRKRKAQREERASIELQPDSLDHLAADSRLRADEVGQVLRRFAGCRLKARGDQRVAHGLAVQHSDDFMVQSVDDRGRRLGRRDDALPDAEVETGQGLGDGRNFRRNRAAVVAGQRDDFQLSGAGKG